MKKIIYPAILVLVTAGMYFSAIYFPFIGYDNNEFIIENPLLGSWDWNNFIQIWKIGGVKLENLYIPLTYVTYFIETALTGKKPFLIHLDNILLHIANCILLFYFAKRMGMKSISAFIASLAFSLHPLQVEPVVWCMGRKDLLSTFFALVCMHSYLSFSLKSNIKWILITLFSGVSAMLAKPVMVILPGVLLIMESLLIKSYDSLDTEKSFFHLKEFINSFLTKWKFSLESQNSEKSFIIRKILIIVLAVYSLLTVVFNMSGPFRAANTKSFSHNFLCIVYLVAGWIKRFFMAESVEHFYRWPSESILYTKAAGGFVIIFVTIIVILYLTVITKYDRKIVFGLIFFLISFLPPLAHLKYTQDFITADRYGYFPLIGIFIAAASFYDSTKGLKNKVITAFLSIWFILIFINNISAVKTWSSDIKFWQLEVETKPESIVDNYFLGLSYQRSGDYRNALKYYLICMNEKSEYKQKALISSGSIFFNIKKYNEARKLFKEALNYQSEHNALIYYNLGETYRMQRKIDMAFDAYKKSLELDNMQAEPHLRIAQIYLFKLNHKLAREHAVKAEKLGIELTDDLKKAFGEQKQ